MFELKTQNIRGLKTPWLTCGKPDNPILLLLHGFPDTPYVWKNMMGYFEQDFEVIALFTRGVGASEKPKDVTRYGVSAMTLDILQILDLDQYKNRDVYIVGHDLGGVHGWSVAELLGHRAKGFVVINSLSLGQFRKRLKNPRQVLKSWYIFLTQIPFVPEFLTQHMSRQILSLAHKTGERPAADKDTESVEGFQQYREFMKTTLKTTHEESETKKVICPVLVLWGARDGFLVPPQKSEFQNANTQIRILDTNHWPQLESPDLVNKTISQFFKDSQ